MLHPVHKNSKNQTTVKWRSPNPDFHEQFVYSSSGSDLAKQSLFVTVWHRPPAPNAQKQGGVKPSKDVYIGGVIIGGASAKGSRMAHWVDLQKQTSTAHKRTHFLSANFLDWFIRLLSISYHYSAGRLNARPIKCGGFRKYSVRRILTNSVLSNHPGLTNRFWPRLLHKKFGFNEYPGLMNNWLGPERFVKSGEHCNWFSEITDILAFPILH